MCVSEQDDIAVEAYIGKIGNVLSMLERLTRAATDHFDTHPDDIDWSHVSNLGRIERNLKQICDQTFNEGEYAPMK